MANHSTTAAAARFTVRTTIALLETVAVLGDALPRPFAPLAGVTKSLVAIVVLTGIRLPEFDGVEDLKITMGEHEVVPLLSLIILISRLVSAGMMIAALPQDTLVMDAM